MRTYKSSDGLMTIKAKNTQDIIDNFAKYIAHNNYIIHTLCMQVEGVFIVLEHGDIETFMQTFPHYKKIMKDWLAKEGYDVFPDREQNK